VIVVHTETISHAASVHTQVSKAYEIAKGIVVGNAPSVNKLREVSQEDIQQYRAMH